MMETVKSPIPAGLSICDSAVAANTAKIEGGSYRPLHPKEDMPMISVKPYQIDKYLVTNVELSEFVQSHPQW